MAHRAHQPRFTLIDLTSAGLGEHARLIQSRALFRRGTRAAMDASGELVIAFSSRPSLRRRLGSRALVVLEAALQGPCGVICAAHSTALLVDVGGRFSLREMTRRLPEIVRAAAEWLAAERSSPSETWRQQSIRLHAAFWETRWQRERRIDRALTGDRDRPFQAGLFDLRAERARAERLSREQELRSMSRRRLIDAMRAPLELSPVRGALVLVPWRS